MVAVIVVCVCGSSAVRLWCDRAPVVVEVVDELNDIGKK